MYSKIIAVCFFSYIHWSFLVNIGDTGGKAITSRTQASAGCVKDLEASLSVLSVAYMSINR